MFGIRPDYIERPTPFYYLDDVPSVRGITFQPDVYALAEFLAVLVDPFPTLLDIGAGWGEKLAAIHDGHPDWSFTALDYGDNADHLDHAYPWLHVHRHDLEDLVDLPAGNFDLIICSDVVEHLVNPEPLLRALLATGSIIVLSTPDRLVEHGPQHRGPSPNVCHVREWTAEELHSYLAHLGFTIRFHGLTRGSDQGFAMGTQLVVMHP